MKKMLLIGLLVLAAGVCVSWAEQPQHETELLPITVGRGSTLWSIAETNIKDTDYKDIREYIDVIRKDNNLGRTGYIYPGQTLMIRVNK